MNCGSLKARSDEACGLRAAHRVFCSLEQYERSKIPPVRMHREPAGPMHPCNEDKDEEAAVATCRDQGPQTRQTGGSLRGCRQGEMMTLMARRPPTWHFVDIVLEESRLRLIETEFLSLDETGAQNTN